jgi:hypothetical protein
MAKVAHVTSKARHRNQIAATNQAIDLANIPRCKLRTSLQPSAVICSCDGYSGTPRGTLPLFMVD